MTIIQGKDSRKVIEKDVIGFKSDWEKEKNNPFISFLLLEQAGNIIGFLFFSTMYDRMEIEQFEILEDLRNQGLGTKLMQFLLEYAKESSVKNITLEVAENNYSAVSLYQKMGFQTVAVRSSYYHGINALLMERKIDS